MEVDEIQQEVCKFQRIASNRSATTDNSSNPNKIATTHKANHHYFEEDGGGDATAAGGGGGGVGRICGWPSSRIVRVSRASGGKDRHSKVLTSKGLRDRRVRLSVTTAIQFYDLQDRLGYDQPSKAVEWLIKAASTSIAELPSLDPSFSAAVDHRYHHRKQLSDDKIVPAGKDTDFEDPNYQQNNTNNISVSKSSACSSTSETSKGSGPSLSRSENRMKARERAREMAAKKEKEKDIEMTTTSAVKGISQSFTDLLTGGISNPAVSPNNTSNPANSIPPDSRIHWTTPMDYFFNRPPQLPQFNISAGENHPLHHFSFLQENFAPATGGGGGEGYNLNFSIASSSSGGGFATGFSRGTLQSNLVSVLPHHHHQHVQRFQSSTMVDGSASTNFPLFMGQTIGSTAPENFPAAGYDSQRLQLYGGADGGRQKEKSKN